MAKPVGIHVITQSTDHYNYCTDQIEDTKDLSSFLKQEMDKEFDYIDAVYCTDIDGNKIRFNYDDLNPEW